MLKRSALIITLVMLVSILTNASVSTWEVSRNISDMQRLIDFNGVYANRSELNRLADESIHILRDPVSGNKYRYAEWNKTYSIDSRMSRMEVEYSSNRVQNISENFENVYSIEISVPKKWGLFHGNDPIFVNRLEVEYKRVDGVIRRLTKNINRWFNPKDEEEFQLEDVAIWARVKVSAACKDGERKDCALYINARNAELKDKYSNPYYRAVINLKEFKDDIENNVNKENALEKLNNISTQIGGNSYYSNSGSLYDDELIQRLKDVKVDLDYSKYDARNKLRMIISNLKDENYNYTVVSELEEALYLIERDNYGDIRRAEDALDSVINRLENSFEITKEDVIDALESIESDLPYNDEKALRNCETLRYELQNGNYDQRVVIALNNIIYLLKKGGYSDVREAENKVVELIRNVKYSNFDNGSSNPSDDFVTNDVKSALIKIDRMLPSEPEKALRYARILRNDIQYSNGDIKVVRGLDRVINLLQSSNTSDIRQAKTIIRDLYNDSPSNNNSSSLFNIRTALYDLKSDLPYNRTSALRKARNIQNNVNSSNYSAVVVNGIRRVITLLEKNDLKSAEMAEKMVDRIISDL